jgi:hypothetical protein
MPAQWHVLCCSKKTASASRLGSNQQHDGVGRYVRPLELAGARRIVSSMEKLPYQRTDYSVVVKNRASPPKLWRWEIYRAGNALRIIYFDTVLGAKRAGKEALQQLLDKLFA